MLIAHKLNHMEHTLRLEFNGVPLLFPLAGIWQYSKSLLPSLDVRSDDKALTFNGMSWSDQVGRLSYLSLQKV